MGLWHYLRDNYPEIEADVRLEPVPESYKVIAGVEQIIGSYEDDKELQAIFERTFGPVKRDRMSSYKKVVTAPSSPSTSSYWKKDKEEYLLVDGYNIIFA